MAKRLALALACASILLTATTVGRADHSWEDFHWERAANPVNVRVVDSLDSNWDSYLGPVSSDWARSQVLDTTITTGASDLLTRTICLPVAGAVITCNANYGPNLWLGSATVWARGDHILQGTVQVNDFYFSQPLYNNAAERRHVLCQEVGHTFGLAHQSESGESLNTCMDYYLNTGDGDTRSTTPNQHDYDQLSQIYAHLDGAPSRGASGRCLACNGGSEYEVVYRLGDITVIQFIRWIEALGARDDVR